MRTLGGVANSINFLSQIKHCIYEDATPLNQGNFKIFLATDNREIENELRAEFADKLVTREKWFAQPGDRIHFTRQCPDAEKSLQDAIIEMSLLAESDYLVYQHNSSFGRMAHLLSRVKTEKVFPLMPQARLSARIKSRVKRLIQPGNILPGR